MPSVLNSCLFYILIAKLVLSGATKLVVIFDSYEESSTNILHVARRSIGKHIALYNHSTDSNLHENVVEKGYRFLSQTFNDVCDSISEGAVAFLAVSNNNSALEGLETYTESFALPLLMTTETCGSSCAPQFNFVPDQVEIAIFDYLKNEILHEVIMLHEEEYDGLLLPELLMSNGIRMFHINAEESSKPLRALKRLFSSQTSFGLVNTRRFLISLSNGAKTNQLLESMISNINYNLQAEILVVGDLHKWQKILHEVKSYEVDLIVFGRDSALKVGYPFAVEIPFTDIQSQRNADCKVLPKQQQEIGKAILQDIQVDLNHNRCCLSQGDYIVWKSFVTDNGSQSLLPVALWGNDTKLLPVQPVRLEEITLRVLLKRGKISSETFNPSNDGNPLVIFECSRYSYVMSYQINWGRKEGEDWTGAIGLLTKGEADLIPFFPIMPSAQEVVDFTKPIAFTAEGMLVALPREPSRAFMYFRFYQIEVWILLLSIVLVITCVLRKMIGFHVGIEKPMSFPSCFWMIFGSLLQQGSPHLPRTSACRIILAAWWLLVIVVTTTFSANLVAFLVSNHNKYVVKSLEELANHETVTLAINEESPLLDDFKESKNGLYKKIQNVYLENKHRRIIYNPKTWNYSILNDVAAGATVLIDEISTLRRWRDGHSIHNGRCNLALLPEQFRSVALAFGLRKRSSFWQPINDEIQKMMESGLLDLWKNKYFSRDYYCSEIDDTGSGQRQVKIDDLQGPFYLLLFGTLFGILLLGSEVIYNKWSRNSASGYRNQMFWAVDWSHQTYGERGEFHS